MKQLARNRSLRDEGRKMMQKNDVRSHSTLNLLRKKMSIYQQFAYGKEQTKYKTKRGTGFKADVDFVRDDDQRRQFTLLKNTFSKRRHRADYSPKDRAGSTSRGRLSSALD